MTPGDAARRLERLPGVLAATLFLDDPSSPMAYLAIAPDADPGALRRAAASVLEEGGLPLSPERIHVGRAPSRDRPGSLPCAALESLEVRRGDNRVTCTVRVRTDGQVTYGACSEPDTGAGRARAAARAALQAAEALDPSFRFGLQGVRAVDLFGLEAVVVLVDAAAGRGHAQLPGAALVERSVEEAAALAALHALRAWSG